MAYVDTTAILVRLREVLDSAQGTLRTIAAGRFDSGLYDGLDVDAQALRALDIPIVEASIASTGHHPASPSVMGNLAFRSIEVEVRVVRSATLAHKLNTTTRDTLRGLAAQDADVIAQALTYPGNLTQTAAAAATGLVSGCLRYPEGGSSIETDFEDDVGARVVSTHRFTGIVNVAPATS